VRSNVARGGGTLANVEGARKEGINRRSRGKKGGTVFGTIPNASSCKERRQSRECPPINHGRKGEEMGGTIWKVLFGVGERKKNRKGGAQLQVAKTVLLIKIFGTLRKEGTQAIDF